MNRGGQDRTSSSVWREASMCVYVATQKQHRVKEVTGGSKQESSYAMMKVSGHHSGGVI